MRPVILYILHLPPPIHGAAMMGKYIKESVLINKSFDCHFINLATAKNLSDLGRLGLKKVILFLQLLYHIYKVVKQINPDLVYVTPNAKGGAFIKDFIVVQLLKYLNCKVIVHYHNKGVELYQDKILYNVLYRKFFYNVKVILLAKSLYKDIKKYVDLGNTFFCPNGIPKALIPQNSKPNNKQLHLMFLSNLLIDKGILILLDACKILINRGLLFQCNIIGGETYDFTSETFHAEIAKRGLVNYVKYIGKRYGVEKEQCMQEADVFILPTLNECFPLVLLEAMQQGKTCIATREGGIPDIIDDGITGFLIDKGNSSVLADKIEILIKNQALCEQMGKNGYQKYSNEFTLNTFENNIVTIFKKVLKK